MNIFIFLKKEVLKAISKMADNRLIVKLPDVTRVTVESPRDEKHGDAATNAAMVLAGQVNLKPFDFAKLLVRELEKIPAIENVEIAGPGFINLKLSSAFWQEQLKTILKEKEHYGDSDMGKGEKVNIEFVSVNPTGPMHVGHVRGAVFGDALAELLTKAGYQVTREYYINDGGAQVDKLAQSAYLRYREAMGENIGEIPEGYYPGLYLKPVGQYIAQKDGDKWMTVKQEDCHAYFRDTAVKMMMDLIQKDLDKAGIHFDVFTSERVIGETGGIEKALDVLKNRGLIYQGKLGKPKSAKAPEDWEPREMMIFKSTAFGDEADRPLKRSDGSYTYFTPDIAYQYDKYQRGFKNLIMVFGADHAGYVARLKSAVKAVTDGKANLDIKLVQMVSFSEDGQPLKMSKRNGTFVTFEELLSKIGKDVVRFFMLTRKNDSQLDFDLVKVKEQSKDNPVFYVQYAYARAYSVFRHAQEIFGEEILNDLQNAEMSLLKDEGEMSLIKMLVSFPRLIEQAAEAKEPHRIAYYLNDLAAAFHALWNKGRDDVQMRFLEEKNKELSRARLALVKAVTNVIASGLHVLGVTPVKEM